MLAGNPCESHSWDCGSSAMAVCDPNKSLLQNPPNPSPPPPPPPPNPPPPPPELPFPLKDPKLKIRVTVDAAARALERVLRWVEEGLGFWERGEEEEEEGDERWHLMIGRRLLEAVA